MILHSENILRAAEFATLAHVGQVRKYSGVPYVTHCFRVAGTVAALPDKAFKWTSKENCIIAAILHDVVEDAPALTRLNRKHWQDVILQDFGVGVQTLVNDLTDPPLEAGNRQVRKDMTIARLRTASPDSHTIKCSDLLDNASDIVYHDEHFGPVFLNEMEKLLPVLNKAWPPLLERCQETVTRLQHYLNEQRTKAEP